MIIKEEMWRNIPLLHIVESEFENIDVPVAIFLHGFTSAKEHNLHYAYNLAKEGIRVLLPDAHLHGVRSENLDEVELALRFWEIVMTNIEELKVLHNEIKERGLSTSAKIGVGGTSMGGISTLGSLKIYDWIDASIIMMGAPGFVDLAKAQIHEFEQKGFTLPVTAEEKNQLLENISLFDITRDPFSLKGRPVYFWHGKNDQVVPYGPTFKFYKEVKETYSDRPNDFVFVTDNNAAHAVTRTGMLDAVSWLASHLNE
ncbi:prolyl oligopeptidase family serine peptidase [Sporosarcina pasteurii]|uniref:Esterase n=1 Tax=Sporosarcina pasteurii TaxID=1474 RepID=A0A380BDW9_SPOPA|nr:prolyl oligopeptidase family serine peptidase [Sporosarcina pasteurii]MDS9470367.1 prolyl oligopeptidase family serine peptidase [Sporosarcina pasteurii]QBQ05924.1 esterase [Sporosarcina pasteurii]SUI99892.1 esterase [Sporosarcina pasteurii]